MRESERERDKNEQAIDYRISKIHLYFATHNKKRIDKAFSTYSICMKHTQSAIDAVSGILLI